MAVGPEIGLLTSGNFTEGGCGKNMEAVGKVTGVLLTQLQAKAKKLIACLERVTVVPSSPTSVSPLRYCENPSQPSFFNPFFPFLTTRVLCDAVHISELQIAPRIAHQRAVRVASAHLRL